MVPRSARIWSGQPEKKNRFIEIRSAQDRAYSHPPGDYDKPLETEIRHDKINPRPLRKAECWPCCCNASATKYSELARRSVHRKRVRAAFWNTLTWPRSRVHRAEAGRPEPPSHLQSFTRPIAMSHQIHTYSELRQQIHDDLPIQHPEWVEPNGESFDVPHGSNSIVLTQRGIQNESIATPHRHLQQHKPARQRGCVIPPEVN